MRDSGAPVPPNLGPESLGIARDLVRRSMDAAALDAYHVCEGVAWRRLMEITFELTSDPAQLHELLARERAELTRSRQADRLEIVTLILDGAPIGRQRAETRLGSP